jgi:hypothetical protein
MAAMTTTSSDSIEARLLRAKVLRTIYEGVLDVDAASSLGIGLDKYRTIRAEIVSDEGRRVAIAKPEEVYAEYLIQMRRIVEDLMRVRRASVREGVFGPAVMAIKTAAEVIDKSIARGQELGVLASAKKPAQLHAHLIAQFGSPVLRTMIVREVEMMSKLLGRGELDISEVVPGDIIETEALAIDSASKPPEEPGENRGALGDANAPGRPPFARGGPAKAVGGKVVHHHEGEERGDDIDKILDD